MAKDSRSGDDSSPPRGRKRRRPPVLDLKAKEIPASGSAAAPTAEMAKAEAAQTRTSGTEAPKADAPKTAASNNESAKSNAKRATEIPWEKWREQVAAFDWNRLASPPVLTGFAGVIAGALIVALLMPAREVAVPVRETVPDPRVGELAGQVEALSKQIAVLAERPVPAPAPDQSGLAERIDKLTAAIGAADQRLAAVEQRPDPQAPDLSTVDQRTAAIEASLKDLRGSLSDLKTLAEKSPEAATPQSIDRIAERIGGLEERIAALAEIRAAPPPLAPAASAPPAGDALAVQVVSLQSLAGALRAGKPFAPELGTARQHAGARGEALAALEPYAAKGLPTVEQLEQDFAALIPKLLRGPEPNGNFFERLMTNAARLVDVRPVGEPEGTSVPAIVARAETRLARRDLVGAINEVQSLPEAERAVAAPWLAAAVQRRDAETLVQKLSETALAAAKGAVKP